jgi:hypothetical protein
VSSIAGNTVTFDVFVNLKSGYYGRYPNGLTTLFDGTTPIATFTLDYYQSGHAQFSVGNLSVGRHSLTVQYGGDASYNPATSAVFLHTVFPAQGTFIDVQVDGTGVLLTWTPNLQSGELVRRPVSSSAWSYLTGAYNTSYKDTFANPNQPYLYQLQDYQGKAISPTVLVMRVSFTDDPVLPGTPVNSVHLKEIVSALNVVRNAASLASFVPPDDEVGDTITASQINGLRGSINETLSVIGVPTLAFTDVLVPGATPIRAVHIQELREAIR